jgi:Tfp pilus assembly protein PilW
MSRARSASGFSLVELLVATGLLMVVSSIVTSALMRMTQSQTTIWNRTEMHSGIRGATELLQQEVGQAGRIAFPNTVTLSSAVAAAASCNPATPAVNAVTVQVSSVSGMFATSTAPVAYVMLTTMDGDSQESIRAAAIGTSPASITACFKNAHAAGTVLMPLGGFATGVIPPTGIANGSSATVLKLYGDINGDGNMVYVEYTCDVASGNLYRNAMAFTAGTKPAVTAANVLLSNIIANPGGTACFTYQTSTITVNGTLFTFVLDVAITLTVQTQQLDPITRTYQTETKALLNVSPRNVFNAWSFAGYSYTDRIQSTPASIVALLP